MQESLQAFALEHRTWFILISLLLNVVLSVLLVVPSAFLTTTNVVVFGTVNGFWLSLAGEAIGAVVSFLLYRYGFSKSERIRAATWVARLKRQGPVRQMLLVFLMRLLPFVPSGVVTFAAALAQMGLVPFAVASTAGKVPALLVEVLGVAVFVHVWTTYGNGWWLVFVVVVFGLWWLRRSKNP